MLTHHNPETVGTTPLYGLVLAGGASTRMGQDKARLVLHGRPQFRVVFDLVAPLCSQSLLSLRAGQWNEDTAEGIPVLFDRVGVPGPLAGILAAMEAHPEVAWLVVACDLPFLDRETLSSLVRQRDKTRFATAFRNVQDGFPEPLCAIYEPAARQVLETHAAKGIHSPRRALQQNDVCLLTLEHAGALENVNTPEDVERARRDLGDESHE